MNAAQSSFGEGLGQRPLASHQPDGELVEAERLSMRALSTSRMQPATITGKRKHWRRSESPGGDGAARGGTSDA